MACAELQRLLEELDLAERELSVSQEMSAAVKKAQQVAEKISQHRERHADCDFKPLAN